MKEEIAATVFFITRLAKRHGKLPRKSSERLAVELTAILFDRYRTHWYPEKPEKGQAFRCMRMNKWQLRDPVLEQACWQSDVDYEDMGLPKEITIWVDPGEVCCSSFSNIQSVLIAGYIDTPKSSQGIISYSTDLYYYFTCRYPLEYFLNNTQILTSSVSLAMSDNNGSFISTLSMKLYNDSSYSSPLTVPDIGIPLQTLIYVEVSANNLTENFNVLLDHCFATPSPFNATGDDGHNFFIGCNKDVRTTIVKNGVGQKSQFFFEAFRFVQHRDKPISTLYLHCITRLCQPQDCQNLLAVSCPSPISSIPSIPSSLSPLISRSSHDSTDAPHFSYLYTALLYLNKQL
ncbi:ZPLD1 protein, partial [Amia calva]|nr:ZPLD1 protein [Amia calva]